MVPNSILFSLKQQEGCANWEQEGGGRKEKGGEGRERGRRERERGGRGKGRGRREKGRECERNKEWEIKMHFRSLGMRL